MSCSPSVATCLLLSFRDGQPRHQDQVRPLAKWRLQQCGSSAYVLIPPLISNSRLFHVPPFRAYFDASKGLLPSDRSPKLDVTTELKRGDLVVVEAILTRRDTEIAVEASSKATTSSPTRKVHVASYCLLHMWRLQEGTDKVADDETDHLNVVGPASYAFV